jgi:branched-chain amino acid aminotransferase
MLRRSAIFNHPITSKLGNPTTFCHADLLYKGTRANFPALLPPNEKLGFGLYFSHHMLQAEWTSECGWSAPEIIDFGNLSLPPQCGALHYALQNFEGLKAYLNPKGQPVMFRPIENAKRQLRSCQRLAFPTYDVNEWVECLKTFVSLEKAFIPAEPGYSLYLRPTAIGINNNLRVGAADRVKWFVIASPVGPYYPEGFKPISLYVEEKTRRAFPGGSGDAKLGANYGPTIAPGLEAMKKGYSQILWLNPNGNTVDEVGAMNFLVYWKNKNGEDELITAPLDGTILPGITRDSLLTLARGWGEFKVSEKRFSIDELTEAILQGRVKEMFGCGTAAVVSPVKALFFRNKIFEVPVENGKIGPLAERLWKSLTDIQLGKVEHEWCVPCQ